ncbi:hypothetical protein LEMLEM_LOCUS7731 [Lemmus lemmus]
MKSLPNRKSSRFRTAAHACSSRAGLLPQRLPEHRPGTATERGKEHKRALSPHAPAQTPCSDPSPPRLARLPPASFPGHLATSQRVTCTSSNHSRFPSEPRGKRRAGRGEGDGKNRLRGLARCRHPIRAAWGAPGRGPRRGRGWGRGKGTRRLRDERAGSRRLKAANQSAPASFGERRGASPPPPRAPGAG